MKIMKKTGKIKTEIKDSFLQILFCFLTALGVLLFCTKCSMLYPFQDGMDVNCFFTVGKAMMQGKVLYRDIYEHKGILLYVVYGLAYILSNTSFIAVFWLEVICATFYLFYSNRLIQILSGHSQLWTIPIIAFITYTGYSFSYGGQIEELVLPILAWALYTYIRYGIAYRDGKKTLSLFTVLMMGIFSAILFWMKYTLTGFFLGLVLFMFLLQIKEKNWKYLCKCAVIFLGGFLVITIPVLLYFVYHHALNDLWQVYFYNMLFRYNARDIGMSRIEYSLRKVLLTFWRNKRYSLLIVLGVLWYTFQKKQECSRLWKCGLWILCFSMTVGIFYSTQYNRYWGEALAIFSALGLVPIVKLFHGKMASLMNKKRYFVAIVALLICIVLSRVFSMNAYLMKYQEEEMPQYIFKQLIEADGQTGSAILNYGCLDLGMYTVLNVVPECKYFCDYNINYPIIYETQEEYITSGSADYIVTRSSLDFAENLYEQIGYVEFEMEFRDYIQTYYLYRRIDLLEN